MQKEITEALSVLQKGGSILYPTDTIWGIGCDATNETAVKKIYQIKNREESKSMIVLLDDEKKLTKFVEQIPEQAYSLINDSKKPLTIIYSAAKNLARNVIAGDGSAAIRITKDDFCKKLIEQFGKPIVSTSANISGTNPPKNFKEIAKEIIQSVDYVVNLRQNEIIKSAPSTVIRLKSNGEKEIIRE